MWKRNFLKGRFDTDVPSFIAHLGGGGNGLLLKIGTSLASILVRNHDQET